MSVPRGARARLERNARANGPCRIVCLKEGINTDSASKPLGWSTTGRLRTNSFDFHCRSFVLWDDLEPQALRFRKGNQWMRHRSRSTRRPELHAGQQLQFDCPLIAAADLGTILTSRTLLRNTPQRNTPR
jgi:hypothetical protein